MPTHLSILAAEKTFDERRLYVKKLIRATLRKPQGDEVLEEEKACQWLDAELAGGGNAKEVDEGMAGANEDIVMDDFDDAEGDSSIECQCCFADYPFVRTSLFYLFYLIPTFCVSVQNGSMCYAIADNSSPRYSRLLRNRREFRFGTLASTYVLRPRLFTVPDFRWNVGNKVLRKFKRGPEYGRSKVDIKTGVRRIYMERTIY